MVDSEANCKTIVVKGIITKKIVFENRPAPDMDRALMTKKEGLTHAMFDKQQGSENKLARKSK